MRCGTCVGACPKSVWGMDGEGFPVLDKETCSGCGLCWDVCPGKTEDFQDLEEEVQGKRLDPGDVDGSIRAVYLGRSTNAEVMRGGTSGGMATQLLLHALETGAVEAVLAVGCHPDIPWKPVPVLARTSEEIRSCARSKYSIVPLNAGLAEAREVKGSIACVGLPCHVRGVRLLMRRDPFWRDKIGLVVGLYCHHPWDEEVVLWLLKKNRIRPEDVKSFQYRGGAWPGWIQARKRDGVLVTLHPERTDVIVTYPMLTHAPNRCLLCTDGSNRLADISLGDGWLCKKAQLEPEHWSTVVARTAVGERLLEETLRRGAVRLETVKSEDKLGRLASMAREKYAVALSLMGGLGHGRRPVPEKPKPARIRPDVRKVRLAAYHLIFFLRQYRWGRTALVDFFLYKMRPFRKPLKEMAKRFSSRGPEPIEKAGMGT